MLEHASTLHALRRRGEARKLEIRAQAALRNRPVSNVDRYTVGLLELEGEAKR